VDRPGGLLLFIGEGLFPGCQLPDYGIVVQEGLAKETAAGVLFGLLEPPAHRTGAEGGAGLFLGRLLFKEGGQPLLQRLERLSNGRRNGLVKAFGLGGLMVKLPDEEDVALAGLVEAPLFCQCVRTPHTLVKGLRRKGSAGRGAFRTGI